MVEANEPASGTAPCGVGEQLRAARAAAGLGLADVAARTRVGERQLAAIEDERFGDLASGTYAVGFARSYARAVGLDEHEVAARVRAQLELTPPVERTRPAAFEPGDPARAPSRRVAWLAALGVVVALAAIFLLYRSFLSPAIPLSDLSPLTAPLAARRPPPRPAVATVPSGAVAFTATEPDVWVKFYDAAGKQLLQKQLARGESFTVPADAAGPKLWTGRPDALAVTIGGRAVARIADKPGRVKDVPVDARSLLARGAGAGGTTIAAPSAATPSATPTAAPSVPAT